MSHSKVLFGNMNVCKTYCMSIKRKASIQTHPQEHKKLKRFECRGKNDKKR